MIYIDLLLVALVTIYIVDISGFTESWRDALAHILKVKALKPIKPFDCGKCMTWWVCLIYCLVFHQLSLFTIAFSALLSMFSYPIGQILIFVREWTLWLIGKAFPR